MLAFYKRVLAKLAVGAIKTKEALVRSALLTIVILPFAVFAQTKAELQKQYDETCAPRNTCALSASSFAC